MLPITMICFILSPTLANLLFLLSFWMYVEPHHVFRSVFRGWDCSGANSTAYLSYPLRHLLVRPSLPWNPCLLSHLRYRTQRIEKEGEREGERRRDRGHAYVGMSKQTHPNYQIKYKAFHKWWLMIQCSYEFSMVCVPLQPFSISK